MSARGVNWHDENEYVGGYEHEMESECEDEMRREYEAEVRREHMADMMADMPSRAEIAEWKREADEYHRTQAEVSRAGKELADFYVNWDDISLADVKAFRQAIDQAQVEEDIQRFLTDHKQFLIQHLSGGHGRYVMPKPRLGIQAVPDYLLAELSSMGIRWHGIELESPRVRSSRKDGQPTQELTHAIQQVTDWREWLTQNIDYARRPSSEGGLSLVGIDGNISATILIGRRQDFHPRFNAFRRQTVQERNLSIRTYDWLIDESQSRALALGRN